MDLPLSIWNDELSNGNKQEQQLVEGKALSQSYRQEQQLAEGKSTVRGQQTGAAIGGEDGTVR